MTTEPRKKPAAKTGPSKRSARPKAPKRLPAKGKREQNKTALRIRIIQSGSRVFGRLGHADTRVEDILEDTGISRPTFYRFFSSKDTLFEAIYEQGVLSLLQRVGTAVANGRTPVEKLEQGTEAYLRWLAATGPIANVFKQEAMRPGSPMGPRREATLAMMATLFDQEMYAYRKERYDPILLSTMVAAIEHVGNELSKRRTTVREADIERGMAILRRVVIRTLAKERQMPPLPLHPDAPES